MVFHRSFVASYRSVVELRPSPHPMGVVVSYRDRIVKGEKYGEEKKSIEGQDCEGVAVLSVRTRRR